MVVTSRSRVKQRIAVPSDLPPTPESSSTSTKPPNELPSIALSRGRRKHAFEMIVLGSGGGPLETDCSGYLVKPLSSKWEEGLVGLEGGSGLGALTSLLTTTSSQDLFPGLIFPKTHDSPVLKAAYVFSLLTCYFLTHAHLDHVVSLILLSGSIPPRLPPPDDSSTTTPTEVLEPRRTPIYAMPETLARLSLAYKGEIWPELGSWAGKSVTNGKGSGKGGRSTRKRIRAQTSVREDERNANVVEKGLDEESGSGVAFYPLSPSESHTPLHPGLPITTLVFPVAHGSTSYGIYESSAIFIRYDPTVSNPQASSERGIDELSGREFLFFGDLESSWRPKGDEGVDEAAAARAGKLNMDIWREAAKSILSGRLGGIFIECSYDSSRAAGMMYGHMSPPALYYELKTLANLLPPGPRPLDDLNIYVTHIKPLLVPHHTGLSARELIIGELEALEKDGNLGVKFLGVRPGDRIVV